ncbi:FAD-binding oxidoreductase [Myxococcota bacterium]|nr:FAD-binding oxidoreductase [Myxococcota bacterium]
MSVHMALPAGSREAPPDDADLLIVGGGIMGLGVAYNAARLGLKNIVVLEKSYLCSGASGRNGGGVRMQWSTEDAVRLMRESVEICKNFGAETGVNVWFRQGGYLFLVKDRSLVPTLEKNVAIQNACGVPTNVLTPAEAKKVVPELNLDGVVAASFNPKDGVLFPWPFLWGYASRAMELGVALHTYAEVFGLDVENGSVTRVHVRAAKEGQPPSNVGDGQPVATIERRRWEKSIRVKHVINAASAWSPELAKMAGLDLPNRPYRHEILTTEPLKAFLDPMVTILGEGLYFSQSMRGEIVGGMGDPNETSSFNQSSSLGFLQRFSRAATKLIPHLGNVQVMRQWAGLYDVSPDGRPILGEAPGLANLTHLAGFTGHGFMMAPIISKLCAERLVKGAKIDYFDKNGPERFAKGAVKNEESMIIG